ncbi:YcgN family cysteine cluster protein [Paremcibacter congregatus]|uniref:YcgN family cysteine cluster protein n=1 Tax=Paremcibacter congregatus TaxID=2043170 RepID=UPI0030EC8375|tara:strand:+ start:9571 stop:10062 length:492 start_codon:yes stop_codon:yes gene_type:complete
MTSQGKFWHNKKLTEMSVAEWESLCDGCGLCCLHKLEDADTHEVSYTNVACRLLDTTSCQCRNYPVRKQLVPDCVQLTPDQIGDFHWLPESCAYRLISEGKDLAPWHPLNSGNPDSVHDAGISVRGKVISERDAGDMEDHVVEWDELIPNSPAPEDDGPEEDR